MLSEETFAEQIHRVTADLQRNLIAIETALADLYPFAPLRYPTLMSGRERQREAMRRRWMLAHAKGENHL